MMNSFTKTRERRWRQPRSIDRVLTTIESMQGGEFTIHDVLEAIPFKHRPHANAVAMVMNALEADGYVVSVGTRRVSETNTATRLWAFAQTPPP